MRCSTSLSSRIRRAVPVLFGFLLLCAAFPSFSQDIQWKRGPGTGDLGDIATVEIPYQYVFAGPDDTRRLMEMMQNPLSGEEVGFLTPEAENEKWYIVFEFGEIGYVKDDEKDALDADAMFRSLEEATEAANRMRKKRGWETLTMLGWAQPPRYNEGTNNLEWATKARSESGEVVVNYNTRLLGRRGVMSVTLVADPEDLERVLPAYRRALRGFGYVEGQRYAEWRSGDRIAKVGLAALVTGGAAAVALKTGILQKLWKLIVVGIAALGGILKKVFRGNRPQEIT